MADVNESYEQRFPDMGKVSVAILEHLVSPVIGEDAQKELKKPVLVKEENEKVALALMHAEDRFKSSYSDVDVRNAVLGLSLANLPSVDLAVREFYQRPNDEALGKILGDQLQADYPHLTQARVDAAVSAYLGLLKEELVNVSAEIRDKLNTIANLRAAESAARTAEDIERLVRREEQKSMSGTGNAPRLPTLFIGREDDVKQLRKRFGVGQPKHEEAPLQIMTTVQGWPGVGKTTLASVLAHDTEISEAYPDGVLWTSLGQKPNIFSELLAWGRALGQDLRDAKTEEEASAKLAGILRNKRMILIIDDVWKAEHAELFRIGGANCATLVTTRLTKVAHDLAPAEENIYYLRVLSDEKALDLLRVLAPRVVEAYPVEAKSLVSELENLPLAIQVAGRLLHQEAEKGFGVTELLDTLKGSRILDQTAPPDRKEIAEETSPTIAALLKKSTDILDVQTRKRFAYLAPFAPKPATFDLKGMAAVWRVEDPRPTVSELIDRGLMEPTGTGRYQVHALLVLHARSLLMEEARV